ncbi:TolC family protein [Novosphingobium piscinae]|uniref:TolC family protein n=1 Tax=Novosphingobium piscinae TaxID=1507448 RepID=A0A7X1KNP4_9SPHN|nr:TolC family protein [Novosphingobium piscinae]MBC2667842.1 TolC family protein [Novosphingobium piscinae]
MRRTLFPVFVLTTVLTACAGAPPPKPVPAPPSASWSTFDPALLGSPVRLDWWSAFGSPALTQLVNEARTANFDLAAADANLRAAAALAREARLARQPQGGAGAGVQRLREPSATQPPIFRIPGAFPDMTIATIGGELAWEVDLVGARAKTSRAALADAKSALWRRRNVEAAVVAQVVRAWLDLAQSRQLGAQIDARLAALDNVIALAQRRTDRGGGTVADVAVLRQGREGLAAERPVLDAAQRNALRRLAVLTGRDPIAFVRESVALDTRMETPTALAAQDPRIMLRLRPDVQIAEAQLEAAFERAGASRAALYPSLSLGASAGVAATPADIGSPGAFRFAVGPSLNWGILNLGRVKAGIAAADAASEAAAAQWQQTLLAAVEEADGAIDRWLEARRSTAATRSARAESAVSLTAVRSRHQAGIVSTLERLRGEADHLAAETALIIAEANEREAWAIANLALGAGWRAEHTPIR